MSTDYQNDRHWSDKFLPGVKAIIKTRILPKISDVRVANQFEDMYLACDLLIVVPEKVGVRTRRPGYETFGDVTFRAVRLSGTATEVAKLLDGNGKWYFYGWTNKEGRLKDWVFLDMDMIRNAGLIDEYKARVRWNTDNKTGLMAIPLAELLAHGCVIDRSRVALGRRQRDQGI